MNTLIGLYISACTAVTIGAAIWIFVFHRIRFEQKYAMFLSAVSSAIEARTGAKGRTEWARSLCTKVCKAMGCPRAICRSVETSVHLAEIGLAAVPYDQLRRARSNWTDEERAQFEKHPEVGASMLSLIPTLEHASLVVRCHHLSYGGSEAAYLPSGSEIPLESRIIGVVQAYIDAYRDQGDFLAREVVRDGSGTRFDPVVVRALLGVLTSASAERQSNRSVVV